MGTPVMDRAVRGVIDLRGKGIPMAEPRLKFGMERLACTDRTCIVVVEISGLPQK